MLIKKYLKQPSLVKSQPHRRYKINANQQPCPHRRPKTSPRESGRPLHRLQLNRFVPFALDKVVFHFLPSAQHIVLNFFFFPMASLQKHEHLMWEGWCCCCCFVTPITYTQSPTFLLLIKLRYWLTCKQDRYVSNHKSLDVSKLSNQHSEISHFCCCSLQWSQLLGANAAVLPD